MDSSGHSEEHASAPVPASLAVSAGFLLGRVSRILQENNEKALAPLHLSLRELGVMRVVGDEGPLTQQALGKRINLDRTSVVQVVDELEKRQFLTRVQNEQDRRSNLLYLTVRGKKTLAAAIKITNKVQTTFLAPLGDEEWQTIKSGLIKLLQHHLPENG
ncbi:MAG TPA: MarR family transcriptional regulator [Planktothrix sp.]|jgi:DNA-binding MarR family transcriptional regulator